MHLNLNIDPNSSIFTKAIMVIVRAFIVGVVAWVCIFMLRLIPFLEPFIVKYICGILGDPAFANAWHTSEGTWYSVVLEAVHPIIVLGAVVISAIRDIIELWRS
jgi:hypothetical protein